MARLANIVAGCAVLLSAGGVAAHEIRQKNLEIIHPWTAASSEPAAPDAAIYMKIRNRGKGPDRLLSASSARAASMELQSSGATENTGENQAKDSIELKPGAEMAMKPTGPRLVMHGLVKPLYAYDIFQVSLLFEKAGRIDVEVMVEEAD